MRTEFKLLYLQYAPTVTSATHGSGHPAIDNDSVLPCPVCALTSPMCIDIELLVRQPRRI